jgi:hypothetical protein
MWIGVERYGTVTEFWWRNIVVYVHLKESQFKVGI